MNWSWLPVAWPEEEKMTEKSKKILVLGGTGAMGTYLVPLLASQGHQVHVVALEEKSSFSADVHYERADALDDNYLASLLQSGFDAIVDFLIYKTDHFARRLGLLLDHTDHYIYLSSYRVYDKGDGLINETSAQLLDSSADAHFLKTEDYALIKARQEDLLESSGYRNWTIVRPAITYSKRRFQLVTLEADLVVGRSRQKKALVLPQAALTVQGTMTWAGDVAKMLAGLLFKDAALGQAFVVATAEHHSWQEIAEIYRRQIGLSYVAASTMDFLAILGAPDLRSPQSYQLHYDRLFDRRIDNSKILRITGLKQSDLMPLAEGLARELAGLEPNMPFIPAAAVSQRMDDYLARKELVQA